MQKHTRCHLTCPAGPNGSSCPRYALVHSLRIGVSGEPAETPKPCHPHPRATELEPAASQDLAPSCIQLHALSIMHVIQLNHAVWETSGCIQAQAWLQVRQGGKLVSSSYQRVVQGGQHVTAAHTTKMAVTPTEQIPTTPIELVVHTGVQHVHMHTHTHTCRLIHLGIYNGRLEPPEVGGCRLCRYGFHVGSVVVQRRCGSIWLLHCLFIPAGIIQVVSQQLTWWQSTRCM